MSEDIVERLKKLLIPPVWDDPNDMQILRDAIAEIVSLREQLERALDEWRSEL